MGNSTWDNALDPFPNARGAAFNTFTTAKDVSPVPLPVVFGNELRVGSKIELEARGEYSTTGTPTFRLGFHYGNAAGATLAANSEIAGSALAATGSGAAAWPWHLHYRGVVTAVGTGGVMYGHGILDLGTSLTTYAAGLAIPVTAAARSRTSFDTTIQKTFGVFAEFGTSSASNQVIVDVFTAKVNNQGKTA